ncbi:MAG: isochorismatase family protein [Anaerolineae bacterium]
MKLTIRRQSPRTTGYTGWRVNELEMNWAAAQTAMILVDVWDKHWSWGANERVGILAPRIDAVVKVARQMGIFIVHAPSDVMAFYADHPARRWVLDLPKVTPPALRPHEDPPMPVDDSDEGSDTLEKSWHTPWSRQHEAIEILPTDAISDNGDEVYNVLRHKGISNIIYAGVHTNMCVLNRSFAIKRMVRWGFNAVLARDLTDAMYNPMRPPYVSHEAGTRLIIEYIEKLWCPTMTSDDLTFIRNNE